MKTLLLFLLFFTSFHSITLGQSTSLPTSIIDLEEIIGFDESQYGDYLKSNGFYYFKASNGDVRQVYKTAEEVILLYRNVKSANWSLDVATNSEERFNKIKSSLSPSGYKLTSDEQGFKSFESTRNSCEVRFNDWVAGETTTFIFSCDTRLERPKKNPFSLSAKGFREYIEFGNPRFKNCYYDIYVKIPHKIDELTEKDFFTLANSKVSSGWIDNLYELKQLIVKAVNPATGKEELTDTAKYALLVLNEIRPSSIPIVKFIQMLQEIGDQTKDIRATLREERKMYGSKWKCG